MLEARIVSPRGSLYIAAEATPYDVQELRGHVRALRTGNARDLRLTLRMGPATRARIGALVTALAEGLAREGIWVSVEDAPVVPKVSPRASTPRTHRREVLLVEDDPDSRDALAVVLEIHGWHARKAVDGQDALDQLHAGYQPCVILLDLRMPRLDGWGFRDVQRRDPALCGIPVALLTAVDNGKREARRLDVDTVFTKPVDLDAVLGFMEQHRAGGSWTR
ncbi:MAG: response regulator [Candidatus Binatia bacterium]